MELQYVIEFRAAVHDDTHLSLNSQAARSCLEPTDMLVSCSSLLNHVIDLYAAYHCIHYRQAVAVRYYTG